MKWPPAKEKRGCYTALKTDDAAGYAACPHAATVTERMPEVHTHYAAERCEHCGRFLRWLPRPENVERRKLSRFRLSKLAVCSSLSAWDRRFVESLLSRKRFSPKQQQILDRLSARYLGEAA